VDWIHLAQNSDQRRAFMKTVLKLGISFSDWVTVGVSKVTQLMELSSKSVNRPRFYGSL
jgi:hypothetical protein